MDINFKKVHTVKDLAISIIIILAGAGMFFGNKGLGICIAVCGLVSLLIFKGGYKKDGKGILFTRKSMDLCQSCKPSIVDYLKGTDVTPEIKEGNEGGSVRLDVYYNESESIAYAQLYTFSNYTYESETEMVELKGDKAVKLINQL